MATYHNIQPDYWLEIRKEYIIENFEKLLYYIKKYQFDGEKDRGNGEFLNTIKYLVDLAMELSEYSLQRSFISSPAFRLKGSDMIVENILAYRIILAAIMASQKIGEDRHLLLRRMVNLLVVAEKMPLTDISDDLIRVITNCVRKAPIESLVVKWDDIEDPNLFSPSIILYQISRTQFDVDKGKETLFEGNGTVVFTGGNIIAAPVNKTDLLKGNLSEFISIGDSIRVLMPKQDRKRMPTTVDEVADGLTFMTRAQGEVKPSQTEHKKQYSAGQIIPVVVKSSYGKKVEAVSIDKDYAQVKGKININLFDAVRYANINVIVDFFTPGKRFYVEYTPDNKEFTFQLTGGFNQFYKLYAEQERGEPKPAVYIGDYSAGTQWLAYDGFVVNVMGRPVDEDMLEAMEQHIPKTVRISSIKEIPGTVLINGSLMDDSGDYDSEEPVFDMESFEHECLEYIVGEFVKYCDENIPANPEETKISDADSEGVLQISNLLLSHQRLLSNTMPRLLCLQTAHMLSIAAGDYSMGAYIRHELEYQIALARFAAGTSPSELSLGHGPILDGLPEVEQHERIIGMLRNYRLPEIDHSSEKIADENNLEDTVDGLIDASNLLIGKIDDREICRIKFELSKALDVDDQYKSPDHTTYYGVESDTLEFKTSAVCPPKNKLKRSMEYEPDTQKWAILKTICGFLNSTTGGELLIGVRDNGIASGIARDIELLYDDRRIPEANSDRYRTYLKNIVDNAFIAYKSRAQKKSVTTGNITYIIETNDEGFEILRIRVDSYKGDMVQFHHDCYRPEDIHESYIRTSGATVPMSKTVRDATLLKKYHLAGDREGVGMSAIYEARNSKKRVLLKEYTSRNCVRDREIEVFQVFPDSKCILGYDTATREVRLFKTMRWKDAVILDKNCTQSSSSKQDLRPDIFGFVYDPNKPAYEVKVGLSNYGAMLIKEEYPGSESVLSSSGRNDYPWILTLSLNSLEGIGRFVRGLPDECLVDKNSDLGAFLLL